MKKTTIIIILAASFLVVIGLSVFGTLYFTGFLTHRGNFPRGNFQLSGTQADEVNSFFNSNPSLSDMQNYCASNRTSCFYYCRTINPNNEICSQLPNYRNMTQGAQG